MEMDTEWILVQKKTFTKWLNTKLTRPIDNIFTDLKDGLQLCDLIYKLSNYTVVHNKRAITRIQKLENVQNVILFLIQNNVRLINIGASDIVDGNEKLILGLVWTIIKRFVICKVFETDDDLLTWCKAATAGYSVHVNDFGKSWQDGMAFNAIIHRFEPGLIDYASLRSNNKIENLKNAFDVAERELKIPKLIDPEDIANVVRPDEKCVMTYVSMYREKFGEVNIKNKAKRVNDFIEAYNKMQEVKSVVNREKIEHDALVKEINKNNRRGLELRNELVNLFKRNQMLCEQLYRKRLSLYSCLGTVKTMKNFYGILGNENINFLCEDVKNEIIHCEKCLGKVNISGINHSAYNEYIKILSSVSEIEVQVPELLALSNGIKEEDIKSLLDEKIRIFRMMQDKTDNKKLMHDAFEMFKKVDKYRRNKIKCEEVKGIVEVLGFPHECNKHFAENTKSEYTLQEFKILIQQLHSDTFNIAEIKKEIIKMAEDGRHVKMKSLGVAINNSTDVLVDNSGEEVIDVEMMFGNMAID